MTEQFSEDDTVRKYDDSGRRHEDGGVTGRRTAGAVVGALGGAGVAASAYLEWLDDQTPRDMPLERLFQTEISGGSSSYWTSVAAPLAIAGVIALIGLVLRSRLVLTVAGLVGLATLALWIVMTAIDLSPDDLEASDYQPGVWVCVAGLVVLLIGIVGMGRRYRRDVRPEPAEPAEPAAFDDEEPPRPAEF
ncbi:MAG: hypothetical protein ACRDWI_13905 [Jiangellaceae bacterium]